MMGSFLIILFNGCSKNQEVPIDKSAAPTITESVVATPDPVLISSVSVKEDPSYEDFFTEDPYLQISWDKTERDMVDRDLYNYLFQEMQKGTKSVDISAYRHLTSQQITDTACFLGMGAFHITNFRYVGFRDDYKTAILHYGKEDEERKENNQNRDEYMTQMNHLLFNVAPSDYSTYQRFFAVYDYICKFADYTDNMDDDSTISVYSILTKKKGICGSFSALAYYVLNYMKVPIEYVSNEAHAWNIVELGGKRYQSDFTWGAGSPNSNESLLNTVLMDDETRMEGLNNMGFGEQAIYEGYLNIYRSTPAPCTDQRYRFVKDIYKNYALDIENESIYYTDSEGLQRIGLDGTGKQLIFDQYGDLFVCFDGVLYFRGSDYNELYQYIPGQKPTLLDDTLEFHHLNIENGILSYGTGYDTEQETQQEPEQEQEQTQKYENIDPPDEPQESQGPQEKKIDLNSFLIDSYPKEESKHLETVQITKQHTFSVAIEFSKEMDTTLLPKEQIGLVTDSGQTLPVHLAWSADKKTLTIRSKSCILEETGVVVYIGAGILDAEGTATSENQDISVQYEEVGL